MSFCDGFKDGSKINSAASSGWMLDARELVCQTRSKGALYFTDQFLNLAKWQVITGADASVSIVDTGQEGTNNPAGMKAAQLFTGTTPSAQCTIQRIIPYLPKNYGIFTLIALLENSGNVQDSLYISIQNTVNNKVLQLLYYSGGMLLGNAAGSFIRLSDHSNESLCEWWIEVKDNTDGSICVKLYAGTELVGSQTVMPTVGLPTDAGKVQIYQQSNVTAGQKTWIGGFDVGDTQLPDNLIIQSNNYQALFNARSANFTFRVEDVCNDITLNEDFTLEVKHAGTDFQAVQLEDIGPQFKGIIDFTKDVREFSASFDADIHKGDNLAYRIKLLNGKFGAIESAGIQLTSIY